MSEDIAELADTRRREHPGEPVLIWHKNFIPFSESYHAHVNVEHSGSAKVFVSVTYKGSSNNNPKISIQMWYIIKWSPQLLSDATTLAHDAANNSRWVYHSVPSQSGVKPFSFSLHQEQQKIHVPTRLYLQWLKAHLISLTSDTCQLDYRIPVHRWDYQYGIRPSPGTSSINIVSFMARRAAAGWKYRVRSTSSGLLI